MDGVQSNILTLKQEIDRVRVRTFYLQRTVQFLATRDWHVSTDDVTKLQHALLTLNNIIDANVIYLSQMGEFVIDAEAVLQELPAVSSGEAVQVYDALATEVIDAVAEIGEQRVGLDESVTATRELMDYFLEDTTA